MHDDLTRSIDDRPQGPVEAPAPLDSLPGSWGSFRLLARVGYGGFGEVYRAWDPHLEREVALKLLLPNGSGTDQSDAEYKAMLREARAMASVRHPNIVPVYGIDRQDGRVGFWMDFVRGKTLSALLGSQGPFGYREAALIGLDVSRALSAVHRTGLLHRDIKAENVMREEGGRILLMDLGLSSLQHGQTTSSGTPNYMAPEIWQGEPATVESDIYAMGVLLFFMVTGEYPVRLGGMTTREAAEAVTHRRTLMDLRSDLPESFLRTVSTAMESDPAKRFSSAGQLAAALSECLGTVPHAEFAQSSSTIVLPATEKPKRPLAVRAAIAALVLIAVAVYKTPAVQRLLHPGSPALAAEISTSDNDQYIKAQALLKKSYKDSNVADAITIFQQILKNNPGFALAESGLGNAYFAQYRNSHDGKLLDLAREATEKALAMQPDLAPALATRARIEATTGQTDLALKDATEAKKSDPRSAEALAALAEVYNALGRRPDAVENIQNAIAIDDKNTMLLVRLGNYYKSGGDLKSAAAEWQKAVEIDPENTFAYYDLGIANMRLDKLPDARQDLEKVLRIAPDADSYHTLGSILSLEGNFKDAIDMENRALKLDPTNQEAWAGLGYAYLWSADKRPEALQAYAHAIDLVEKRIANAPDDSQMIADLADDYASVGNVERSGPLARKALALSPDDPEILFTLGDTYELLGQRTEAIKLIAKALAQGVRVNEFQHSPGLASLRADSAFAEALNHAKEQAAVDSAKKMN